MKSFLALLFVISSFVLPAQAQLLCSDVYASTYRIDSRPVPVIGLIVQYRSEKKKLLIGPYIGRGHGSLLESAMELGEVTSVLWGGELLISYNGSKYTISRANETSGLVQDLAYDRTKISLIIF